jgi:hypothetical protein
MSASELNAATQTEETATSDAAADAAAAAADTAREAATAADTPDTEAAAPEVTAKGEEAPPEAPTPSVEDLTKAAKENPRLKSALAGLNEDLKGKEAENKALREQLAATKAPAKSAAPKAEASEFDALPRNEDGEVYYKGRWTDEADARDRWEVAQDLAALKQGNADREAQDVAARQAAAGKEWQDAAQAYVIEQCDKHYPKFDGERKQLLQRYILAEANTAAGELAAAGEELSEALLAKACNTAFTAATALFGSVGAEQLAKNREYEQTHKVKPDAPAGTPAVTSLDKMGRRDRDKLADDAAAIADAERAARRG